MAQVTKNTIPEGAISMKQKILILSVNAVNKGLEVIRSRTVPKIHRITGRLAGSLTGVAGGVVQKKDTVFFVKRTKNAVEGYVGTNVPYAKHYEFGTSRMKGRHSFRDGFLSAVDDTKAVIAREMNLSDNKIKVIK